MQLNRRINAIVAKLLSIVAVFACLFAFMPTAHAEEARISITANPTELTDSGAVTFTFEIANYNADYPMTDVAITYNSTVYDVLKGGQIPPSGSARDITLVLNVPQSQLGKPITFLVTWTRNGEPMSQEAQYTIAQAENPVITVTRTASRTNAKTGDKIEIDYIFQNNTKFDMTNIALIDENVSDNIILELPKLLAGDSYTKKYDYYMGEESVTSTPLVTYTVNEKTKTLSSIEPLELTMILVRLSMNVQAGTPTPSGVTFTLDVSNTGTQAVNNITISDERTNLVNETPFSLEPGEQTTLSYLVVPLMTEPLREVQFFLVGIDPFGEKYEINPNENDVYQVYPFVDESQISVTVRAETVTPWTQESGSVSARVIIVNHSSVELNNITVSEATIGVIKNYDILPVGETSFDQDIQLGSPRNLSITVKGYDPTGTNRELATYVMPVAYGTQTTQEATVTPTPSSGSNFSIFNGISNGISKILIILGVLMVFSFVILVVLTAMERSRAPRTIMDDDEDDYHEHEARRAQNAAHKAYHDAPDADEISYTKRMFAIKDEEPHPPATAPIRLPPAQPRPQEQPRMATAPIPSQPKPTPRADEVAHKLVQTARSRYTEEESRAEYRPVSEEVKPYVPQPPKTQYAPPRVFERQKQPKVQPAQKQIVTRVQKTGQPYIDDEE